MGSIKNDHIDIITNLECVSVTNKHETYAQGEMIPFSQNDITPIVQWTAIMLQCHHGNTNLERRSLNKSLMYIPW